jgi:tRNA (mo5U34)-methyltransferase
VTKFVFDEPHYASLNRAGEEFLRRILSATRRQLSLTTAIDVGCGLGHYSAFLKQEGFSVMGVDGRAENAQEAQRRFPEISFQASDAEDPAIRNFGAFDVVLCQGLLYHLENPFQAMRNLQAITRHVLVVNSMCVPDSRPVVILRDEGPSEDQGLRHVAFYPSEACLVKLMYKSGFPFVYTSILQPAHPDYYSSATRKKARTVLIGSRQALENELLSLAPEPASSEDLWSTPQARVWQFGRRLASFAFQKPWSEKAATLRRLIGLRQAGEN